MCGIVGLFSSDNLKWPSAQINEMLATLLHRGPDGTGVWSEPGISLAHARLAVLDLSSAGSQPMVSHDGNLVISYNGEIYNFRELRKELTSLGHLFSTVSDTEVLLAAWRQWGVDCLGRLDGIFAFAIYDRQLKKLYLVRDPLGIKPIFYRELDGGALGFASELPALYARCLPPPELDPADLDSYFTFNYLFAPRTGLKGVKQLPGGHLLTADAEGVCISRYWKPEHPIAMPEWGEDLVEEFSALMKKSVQAQMVSDVPIGLFLSGGLDSYAVALSAVSSGALPLAFTLGFESKKHDETQAAADYSKHLGISQDVVLFKWDEHEIRNTLAVMGELLADSSCFPIHQLCRYARTKSTVILAGDGGDELLAGYSTYLAGEITSCIRLLPSCLRRLVLRLANYLPSDDQRYGKRMVLERLIKSAESGRYRDHASFRRIFWDSEKQFLYTPEFYADTVHMDPVGEYASLMHEAPSESSYLKARQHADLLFHLPSVLAKVDRMSMACGLEVRVPLLSRSMVDFCLALPDNAKRKGTKGKRILREALAHQIPQDALRRPKAGFLPPVDQWFRNGPMTTVFGDFLAKARRQGIAMLNWANVESYWQMHRRGEVEGGFVLLGILQYMNWSMKWQR